MIIKKIKPTMIEIRVSGLMNMKIKVMASIANVM